jgi:hypothetical protein
MIQRRRGRIIVLQGIDFTPMLATAEELGLAALEAEAELAERRQLAARVSALKRQLRATIATKGNGGAVARAAAVLEACPARHRALSLRELAALAGRLEAAARLLTDVDEPTGGRIFSSDRTDEIVLPYTTGKCENPVCRTTTGAGGGGADALRHLILDMLAAALPFDWWIRIVGNGALSWANLSPRPRSAAPRSA